MPNIVIDIPIPNKGYAKISIPDNLTLEDAVMITEIIEIYINRLKKLEEENA